MFTRPEQGYSMKIEVARSGSMQECFQGLREEFGGTESHRSS